MSGPSTIPLPANPRRVPEAAYKPKPGSILNTDRAFYDRIASSSGRKLVEKITLPIRSGIAWKVPAGCVCRLITPEGPQVGDLNLWYVR